MNRRSTFTAKAFLAASLLASFLPGLHSQPAAVELNGLSAFRDPSPSWQETETITGIDGKKILVSDAAGRIIVNLPSDTARGRDLISALEHGDADVKLEYLLPEGSNSGIYLQGRYELQLLDSWGKQAVGFSDNGGIYQRWDDSKPDGQKGFEGTPPARNVSRAPGLWQSLHIAFQAPRFDASGAKTENARILRAELNGAVIHENVELTGPTRGSISAEEAATGPLRIQGDHGPIALRNIRLVLYDTDSPRPAFRPAGNRLLVDPQRMPLIRSFMNLPDGTPLTHAVSVCHPSSVHYTFDLESGNLVQVWRGAFLDATPMWHFRGDGHSRPLGAVRQVAPGYAPALARLPSPDAPWPENTGEADFRFLQYQLDSNNNPTFSYESWGTKITDEIRAADDGRALTRTLAADGNVSNLMIRVASGPSITAVDDRGLYIVGDRACYIRIDDAGDARPRIRQIGNSAELLLPAGDSVTYSILF